MTKAELRAAYVKSREGFASGQTFANTYALELDEALAGYFGMPPADPGLEGDVPEEGR
jgi:hypothetical protein